MLTLPKNFDVARHVHSLMIGVHGHLVQNHVGLELSIEPEDVPMARLVTKVVLAIQEKTVLVMNK